MWSERKPRFHRDTCANTCSLRNAYAPTLTLLSFSVTYNLGSLLFLRHYFGNNHWFWGEKKKEKTPKHFIIIRETRAAQSLILQSTLKIPTRNHHVRKPEGARAGSAVISGDMRLQRKETAITCMKEKGFSVLMLPFFLFFWLHQLSAGYCPEELPHSFPVMFESTSLRSQKREREADGSMK